MGKMMFADMVLQPGVKALIGEGKLLKFSFNGNFIEESPINFNLSNLREVDIVSVLISNGAIELGLNINQEFSKKPLIMSEVEVMTRLNQLKGLVFLGSREGSSGVNTYTQRFYVFAKNAIDPQIFQ